MADAGTPLRRDAERNRRALLDAARELVRTRGLDVGHVEIARAAGVGIGTAYRRFPTRADLLEALFAEHVEAVVACADRALEAHSGWAGLRTFMEEQLELQAGDRGLRDLLRGANADPAFARAARERIEPAVARLVERAHAEGDLRADVAPGDVVLVHLMVCGLMDAADAHAPELWRRGLEVALRGLRGDEELPGETPSAALVDRLAGA